MLDEYYCKNVLIRSSYRMISLILSGGHSQSIRYMKLIAIAQSRRLYLDWRWRALQEHVAIDIKNAIKGSINDRISILQQSDSTAQMEGYEALYTYHCSV